MDTLNQFNLRYYQQILWYVHNFVVLLTILSDVAITFFMTLVSENKNVLVASSISKQQRQFFSLVLRLRSFFV